MDVGVTMSPTTYFFTAVLSPTARPAVSHRAAFAKTAHFATKTGQVAMTDLCREWGMSKTQVYEILKRWRTEETVATKPRSGRALTDADTHTSACQRSAKVTSRGNRSRRFSQREQVSVCLIKLCIILVKQPACAHFGDDKLSNLYTFSFIYVRELAVEARDAGKRANPGARARVRARKRGTRLKIDGRRYDGAFVRLQRARAIHAMPTTVTSGRVSTSSSPYRLVPAGTGLLRRNRPTLGTR